jgi:hypothetical protein
MAVDTHTHTHTHMHTHTHTHKFCYFLTHKQQHTLNSNIHRHQQLHALARIMSKTIITAFFTCFGLHFSHIFIFSQRTKDKSVKIFNLVHGSQTHFTLLVTLASNTLGAMEKKEKKFSFFFCTRPPQAKAHACYC